MFLTRGQPVVYSGDEQGFTGAGGDKDARQDMFACQDGRLPRRRPARHRPHPRGRQLRHRRTRSTGRSPTLGALRKAHPALRDGVQVTRYAADGPGVFAVLPHRPARSASSTWSRSTTPTTAADGHRRRPASAGAAFDRRLPAATGAGAPPAPTASSPSPCRRCPPSCCKAGAAARRAGGRADRSRSPRRPPARAVADPAEVTADVTGDPLAHGHLRRAGRQRPVEAARHRRPRAPYRVYHDLTGLAGRHAGRRTRRSCGTGRAAPRRRPAARRPSARPPTGRASATTRVVHYQRAGRRLRPTGASTPGATSTRPGRQPWPQGQPFAGEDAYGRFAWVKLKPGATQRRLPRGQPAAAKDVAADRCLDPTQDRRDLAASSATRRSTRRGPRPPARSTVHYRRPGRRLRRLGPAPVGRRPGRRRAGTEWASPRQPDGTDALRRVLERAGGRRRPSRSTSSSTRATTKDPGRRPVARSRPRQGEAWIASGDATVHPTRAAAEDAAVLHYRRADGDYAGWGLHVWDGAANPDRLGGPAAAGRRPTPTARSSGYRWPTGATGAELHRPQGRRQGPARRPAARPGRRSGTRCGSWPAVPRLPAAACRSAGRRATPTSTKAGVWIDRDTSPGPAGTGRLAADRRRHRRHALRPGLVAPTAASAVVDGELAGDVRQRAG